LIHFEQIHSVELTTNAETYIYENGHQIKVDMVARFFFNYLEWDYILHIFKIKKTWHPNYISFNSSNISNPPDVLANHLNELLHYLSQHNDTRLQALFLDLY
jgi:hypothetical protein